MGASHLADRLGLHVRLTGAERAALADLESQERQWRRGAVIVREGEPLRELFVVRSGWLHCSAMLGNGNRQILRFYFPGELPGLTALAYRDASETLTAVTDVALGIFSREQLGEVLGQHPRLGALLLMSAVAERASLADRLASIGRTSARARVAALLCEIYHRLKRLGHVENGAMSLPLTQEEIGDATGLTSVHVNRMMRRLCEANIIERQGATLKVLDEEGLCVEASYSDRAPIDTSWLPSGA